MSADAVTFTSNETRQLVREVRDDLAPIAASIAEMERFLRDLGLRKDLGAAFETSLKADVQAHQRLKSSVSRAYRMLDDISDGLYAIEHGRRRAAHPIEGLSFMKPAAGRRPDILPFEVASEAVGASVAFVKAFTPPKRTLH